MKSAAPPGLLEALVQALRRLPGVGPRAAQRHAYHLLQHDREGARQIVRALDAALGGLGRCRLCNTFADAEPCETCPPPPPHPSLPRVGQAPDRQALAQQPHFP